jgi:hypothetical protein
MQHLASVGCGVLGWSAGARILYTFKVDILGVVSERGLADPFKIHTKMPYMNISVSNLL